MFGRKKDQPGSGYIKDNTLGSSNEISFSVLDAKVRSTDAEDAGDGKTPLGRISLFTLGRKKKPASTPAKDKLITTESSGVSGKGGSDPSAPMSDVTAKLQRSADAMPAPRWAYSAQEVSERKSKRRRSKATAITVTVLIVAVLLAIGGFFAFRAIQHQMDFIGQLDEQVVIVDAQREALQPFTTLVNEAADKPIEDLDHNYQVSAFDFQKPTIDEATAKLKAARKQIERIQGNLVTPGDKERSNNAIMAVNALLNMIELGTKILEECEQYTGDYVDASRIMELLLEGDSAAREAAELGGGKTQNDMRASIDKSNEAIAKFQEANVLATAIRDGERVEGMQLFIDYIALRVSAQESAIKADNAFINVNSAQLAAFGEEYNAKEAEAAEEIAKANGVYPPELVKQAFDAWHAGNDDIATWKSEQQRSS